MPTMSMRSLLVAGLLAGLVGGVLAFGFATAFGEPAVEVAIALEDGGHDHADAPGAEHAEEPVSRGVQSTVGLAVATCAFATALGGLLALAFAFANGRIGVTGPRATVSVVTAVGFVAVALVPFLVYPPNPPGVGGDGTIGDRTAAYFAVVACSLVLAIAAVHAYRRIGWLAVAGYVAAVSVLAAVLPRYDELPEHYPADVLWDFRIASLGTQAVLWAGIGVAFATLLARMTRRSASRVAALH